MVDLSGLGLFQGEEHLPFYQPTGQPAALFIHGFPGTPAEMRPLANVLYQNGWTTQGLLLPGFGREINTLFDKKYTDWLAYVVSSLESLKQKHHPVILVGYSMGGALALCTSQELSPDGLVLIAPFWRVGRWYHRPIWHVSKLLFRTFKPLKGASFDDPRLRDFLLGILPDLDLDAEETQERLRQVKVPSRLLDQLIVTGKQAGKASAHIQVPTLVIQGTQDTTVIPQNTKALLQKFDSQVSYLEFPVDHKITDPANPYWPEISSAMLVFAASLL